MYHIYSHFTCLRSTPKDGLQQPDLNSDFLQLETNAQCSSLAFYFFPAFSPSSVTVCFALCLNIMITATDYRARAQGNVFKHPRIIRKKYISFRTSNNLQHFVETGDLKMADHCKI